MHSRSSPKPKHSPVSSELSHAKQHRVCRIWLAMVPATEQVAERAWLARLSDLEIERWGRYQVPEARRRYLYCHMLLRHAAGRLNMSNAAVDLRIHHDAMGRPTLHLAAIPYAVSLSRCHGMVACAISQFGSRVGVDVESFPQPGWRVDEMACSTMSADEASAWLSVCNDWQRGFLFNWCGKEAYSKALGVGLMRDPRTYRLVPRGLTRTGPQAFEICDDTLTHARAWHTHLSVTDTGHVVSAVCDGAEIETPVLVWDLAATIAIDATADLCVNREQTSREPIR